MIKQPANTDELYAFFVPNLIKPPTKHGYVSSGIQLDRSGWHIEVYHRSVDNALFMWFYSYPNRSPTWVISHGMFTNPSQDS